MKRDSVKELANKIRELPPLNVVVQHLLKIVGDEGASADDVAKALSCDQAIAGKVLELVNSSFYGYTRKISTITRAAVILGNKGVQNLAIAFSSIDSFEKYKSGLPKELFWRHSLCVATAAQIIAQMIKYPEPEEAFVAGLLHDVGALALSCFCPDEYQEVIHHSGDDVCVTEKRLTGINHAQVAGYLLEHWRLPAELCETSRNHHEIAKISEGDSQLLSILYVAEVLARIKGDVVFETFDDKGIYDVLEHLNFSPSRLGDALNLLDRQTRVIMDILLPGLSGASAKKESDDNKFEGCYVIVGFKHQKIEWLRSMIEYLGGESRTVLASKINELAALEPAGCIFDAEKLPKEAIQEAMRGLIREKIPVALYGEIPENVMSSTHYKVSPEQCLPLIFQGADLKKSLRKVCLSTE